MASNAGAVSRVLLGKPLRTDRLGETLLPKRLALPVFCSDPLSSVAYATEQIVLVLGLGGMALLHLTPGSAAAVVLLLVIVVASYRQTCFAYPNGGGAYTVSRDNLGEDASLVAATSLLIDYVLTVAVSVVAGVAAVTSAVPSLAPHAVALSIALRRAPHHGQPARRSRSPAARSRSRRTASWSCVYAMLAVAFVKIGFGDGITAESAHYELRQTAETGGLLTRLPRAAGVRVGLHRADRRGGRVERHPGVPAAQEPQRRGHALDHGRPGDHDVRRDHRARDRGTRAHGRGHRRR